MTKVAPAGAVPTTVIDADVEVEVEVEVELV